MNIVTILLLAVLSRMGNSTLTVSSTAFKNGESIPLVYTCEGKNHNPPLSITDIPATAKSLVIIMDDPDAPDGGFTHWVVWNIPVSNGSVLISTHSSAGTEGKNGSGKTGYTGPCPPTGTHHYHFRVFALDDMLDVGKGADRKEIENAISNHVLATGELIGLYQKLKQK